MHGDSNRSAGGNTMKLSEITAKLTCMKSKAVRVLAASALAGAVLTAAAPAAKAQHFAIGVQFGGQRYYAPPPPVYPAYGYAYGYHPDYRQVRRYEDWRHREWVRHEEAERYRYDRDHDHSYRR